MPTAADLLAAARLPNSRYSRELISSVELREAFAAAKVPEPNDPPGKPITVAEAALFEQLNPAELTGYAARYVLPGLLAELATLKQTGGTNGGTVRPVPEKRGHPVFLTTAGGFAVDAAGTAPANASALLGAVHHAGKWLQAAFGSGENLFKVAGLDRAGLSATVAQLKATLASDLSTLSAPQRDQLLGSTGALLAELIKAIDFVPMVPGQNAELLALRDDAFGALMSTLTHADTSVLVKRGLVGYLAQSDGFNAKLTAPQKADITALASSVTQKAPADYGAWEAQRKDRIVIDQVSGAGENFVFGIVKQFQEDGLDPGRSGSPTFTLLSGDAKYGPCTLEAKVPAGHPLNRWGREMTIEVRVRELRRDMYASMGDAGVDVVHYGGHSNFGNNTLQSLRNAPDQVGDKIVLRDLCAGSDTRNAEAHRYPNAALNAVTSVGSSYFRTTDDPVMGKYAYESEGYAMLMSTVRGLLKKQDWTAIGADMQSRANWWGHASSNNWTVPGDPRIAAQVDDDDDGVPNVFDVLPGYDTTDVAASTQAEFDLRAPEQKADSISGRRVFQAMQFANTAASYNHDLEPLNKERKLHGDPNGIFFEAKDSPNEYVKFRRGQNGERFVQYSSALADMTIESLRAVTFFELVRQLGKENPSTFGDKATQNGMALVFTAAALQFDDSWRDSEIFEGIKRMYGIPAGVSLGEVERARSQADTVRHNYTGDMTAAREVGTRYATELASAGEPAITVT